MTNAALEQFRSLAEAMNPEPKDWQWVGRWESQRMFGITEARAKEYAAAYGGEARRIRAR